MCVYIYIISYISVNFLAIIKRNNLTFSLERLSMYRQIRGLTLFESVILYKPIIIPNCDFQCLFLVTTK